MISVLLVDDDSDLLMLLSLAFEAHGIVSHTFSSAQSALNYLYDAAALPSLVLVDLNIPDLSGKEFIAKVRADIKLKNLKVILTSGCNDIASVAEKSGADGFLGKPFGLDEVDRLVEEELRAPAPLAARGWRETASEITL